MSEELIKRDDEPEVTITGLEGLQLGSIPVNTKILDKAAVETLVSNTITTAYKAGGNITPTEKAISSGLLVASNEGKVYNVSGEFTTTSDFVEGAGITYSAGTNVVVIKVTDDSDPENPVVSYKFDVLGGMDSSVIRQITVGISGSVLTPSAGAVTIPDATTSVKGVTKLSDTIGATGSASTDTAATPSAVRAAIDDLDVSDISGFGAGKTLATLTETDGKIAATFQDISITSSQVSDLSTTIDNAIDALDAEVTSSDGRNVNVKVTEADGVITAVNVTGDTSLTDSAVAQVFAADKSGGYAVGDLVTHNGKLYKCSTAHTGEWDAADFIETTVVAQISSASSSHTHGNITNDGKVGTTADLAIVTGAGGVVTATDLSVNTVTADTATTNTFVSGVTQDSKGQIAVTTKPIALGNIDKDGKIGTTADRAVVTTTDGVVDVVDLTTASPTAGTDAAIEFIATVSQDSKGKITATKQEVRAATGSDKGVVTLSDAVDSTSGASAGVAATPAAVKSAYDLADGKQDPITFDGTYDASTNAAATVSTVTTAVAPKLDTATFVNAMSSLAALATDGTVTVGDVITKVNAIISALQAIQVPTP